LRRLFLVGQSSKLGNTAAISRDLFRLHILIMSLMRNSVSRGGLCSFSNHFFKVLSVHKLLRENVRLNFLNGGLPGDQRILSVFGAAIRSFYFEFRGGFSFWPFNFISQFLNRVNIYIFYLSRLCWTFNNRFLGLICYVFNYNFLLNCNLIKFSYLLKSISSTKFSQDQLRAQLFNLFFGHQIPS
jgi:hypothetical protein